MLIELPVLYGKQIKNDLINIYDISRVVEKENGGIEIIFMSKNGSVLVAMNYADFKNKISEFIAEEEKNLKETEEVADEPVDEAV